MSITYKTIYACFQSVVIVTKMRINIQNVHVWAAILILI